MSIIASAILAAATYTFTPQNPYAVSIIEATPTVVTNEPFAALFDMQKKVEILWAQHTNELAIIRRSREEREKRKQSAIERVKENQKKRKSKLGKASGGVK